MNESIIHGHFWYSKSYVYQYIQIVAIHELHKNSCKVHIEKVRNLSQYVSTRMFVFVLEEV